MTSMLSAVVLLALSWEWFCGAWLKECQITPTAAVQQHLANSDASGGSTQFGSRQGKRLSLRRHVELLFRVGNTESEIERLLRSYRDHHTGFHLRAESIRENSYGIRPRQKVRYNITADIIRRSNTLHARCSFLDCEFGAGDSCARLVADCSAERSTG